ncbi:MAG: hypothetical protein AB1489_33575, partial [Acidobacteriota bacterium]
MLIRETSLILRVLAFLLLLAGLTINAYGQTSDEVKVLIITAHPDDESTFAVTIYKITHEMKGKADIAIITNGEGGFKYSTFAEQVYTAELTDEKVGREYLPTIRKHE